MRTVDGSRTLLEAAEGGLEATGAAAPVTAVLDVIEGLKGQDQVCCPRGHPADCFGLQVNIPLTGTVLWHAVNLPLQSGGRDIPRTYHIGLQEACTAGCLLWLAKNAPYTHHDSYMQADNPRNFWSR